MTTQLIDMNGDGRLDIVISDDIEEARHNWLVYLNTPDPASPNDIIWQPRKISTAPIVQHLIDAGLLSATDASLRDFVPLSRSFTSKTVHVPSSTVVVEEEGDTSFVEWRLQDINGDGYPDLVYNGSQVTAQLNGTLWKPDFQGSRAVLALMNVAGVHLDNGGTNAFSAPIIARSGRPAGMRRREMDAGLRRQRAWPFQPGLRSGRRQWRRPCRSGALVPKRHRARSPQWRSLAPAISMPSSPGAGDFSAGPVAMSQRQLVATTDATGTHYNAPDHGLSREQHHRRLSGATPRGLRDLNGDGIPGLYRRHQSLPACLVPMTWTVAFGTGTGFIAPAVPAIDSSGLRALAGICELPGQSGGRPVRHHRRHHPRSL